MHEIVSLREPEFISNWVTVVTRVTRHFNSQASIAWAACIAPTWVTR